jgi:hypothetical protein
MAHSLLLQGAQTHHYHELPRGLLLHKHSQQPALGGSQLRAAPAHLAVGVARVSQPVHQALLVHVLDAARTLAGVKQGWCCTPSDPATVLVFIIGLVPKVTVPACVLQQVWVHV